MTKDYEAAGSRWIEMTYSELHNILLDLHFKDISKKNYRAYDNQRFDALIVLPAKSKTSVLAQPHIAGVVQVLIGKGILETQDAFSQLIWEQRQDRA